MAKEHKVGKEVQRKYLELQLLDHQLKQLQQQIQAIEQQIVEFNNIKGSLDDFSNIKENSEILVPISPGMFIKGKMIDSKEIIVNVGANAAVKKDVPGAKNLIDKQIKQMETFREEMVGTVQELVLQAQMIQKDLRKLSE